MSYWVRRDQLKIGHWYYVQSGSVLMPMCLIGWCGQTVVEMRLREGRQTSPVHRKVSIFKIREGYNPRGDEPLLLEKATPETGSSYAGEDFELKSPARYEINPGGTGHRILTAFADMEGSQPGHTDEQAMRELKKMLGFAYEPSTYRGPRRVLVELEMLREIDRKGTSHRGRPMTRWAITAKGHAKLEQLNGTPAKAVLS